jgi:signal transduction histidine kinase
VRKNSPQSVFEAVLRPRFLLTAWPWRALVFQATTGLVAATAAVVVVIVGLPWVRLVHLYRTGDGTYETKGILLLAGAILLAVFGPLVADVFVRLERRRLRLVDSRPLAPRRTGWPRYSDPAVWREVAYMILLVTVGSLFVAALWLLGVAVFAMIAAPVVVGRTGGSVVIGAATVRSVAGGIPYTLLGICLIPVMFYLSAVLSAAHDAMARSLLGDHSAAKLAEVSQSRVRLVDGFEAERRRIERDLHDGIQHGLVSLTLQLGMARLDLAADSAAGQAVVRAHDQAKQLMVDLRSVVYGIHPHVLTDLGLEAAIRDLADKSPIPIAVTADLPHRLPEQVEAAAYFVVAEALTNVGKHSGAHEASVRLAEADGTLVIEVRDDGRGGADPKKGGGLADRVAAAGGTLRLSSPPGGPTLLQVELPCLSV